MTDTTVKLEERPQHELLQRMNELKAKGNGSPTNLNDADLEELVCIFAQLRRRSSGPPKSSSKKSAAAAGALEDLL